MRRILILLVLAVIVLSWNFIFTDKRVILTSQARVLQGLSSAITYKSAIEKYWIKHGSLPVHEVWITEAPTITVDLSQTIVKSIEVGKDGPGVISVLYTVRPGLGSAAEIDGKKINLIPVIHIDKIEWSCVGTFGADLLPGNCNPMAGDN